VKQCDNEYIAGTKKLARAPGEIMLEIMKKNYKLNMLISMRNSV